MSPALSVSIFLIQHISNPRRHEPRNIGVVVSDSKNVAYVLVNPSVKNLSRPLRTVAEIVGTDETYSNWLKYWERTLARGSDGLEEIIERQAPTFPVILAGQITGSFQDDLKGLAQRFFRELVVPITSTLEDKEERPVERVLRLAGVASSPNFKRNYEVPSVGLPFSYQLPFSYAWVNGSLTVADRILAHGGDGKVTQTLWKFEHIEKDTHRVAIVDRNIDFRPQALRDYLNATAQVIRVEDPDAATKLRHAFGIEN
jgi:hypothetical protein